MSLIHYLSSIIDISNSLENEIKHIGKKITIPKNHQLLNMHQRCDSIYFIESGLLRGYYYKDDKEITNWFAQENEFATCFYSFISQKTAVEYIQSIETCELIEIQYSQLQNLYLAFPETERIGRLLIENYYIKLEERFLNNQFKTAKERYEWFESNKPGVLQRASLGQIATYLGITQETLSRIRS
jgi:CRP-like cAMP-binding protein